MKALVDEMAVAPGTATAMAKHLHAKGLVNYEPRRGTTLTDKGVALALKVIRRHRLIETFLERFLNYDWSEVHTEAEELEHVVSDRFVRRIDELMEHPQFDPHGDPIPDSFGRMTKRGMKSLSQCVSGELCVVAQLIDDNPGFLQTMKALEILPGRSIRVVTSCTETQIIEVEIQGPGKPILRTFSTAIGEKVLVQPTRD